MSASGGRGGVRTAGLSKTYNGTGRIPVHAVNDVDLEVKIGEAVLITGPSGSGKTTLLSLLGGLIRPSRGAITVAGCDVTSLTQPRLAAFRLAQIGFVFQTFRLLDALTVRENVELPLKLAGASRSVSHQRATSLLEELGISRRASFSPRLLSGGEKQRVAIARALAGNPAVLLADEPTGSLDSTAGQKVIELLCGSAVRRGTTVVIVSHDPRIRPYVRRVFHMEDGRVTSSTSE